MNKRKTLDEQSLTEIRKRLKSLYEYTYFNKEQLNEEDEEQVEGDSEEDTAEEAPSEDGDNEAGMASDDASLMPPNEGEEMQEPDMPDADDEVVNIDELTDAQKNTETIVNDVNSKLGELIQYVNSFSSKLEDLDTQNKELRNELEKRIPTKTEKLNLSFLKSYPYNVDMRGYWGDVEKTSNYRALPEEEDIEKEEEQEFIITLDDVKDTRTFRY